MDQKGVDLFVPGRLCLFGEHSDWAAGHRRQNSDIEIGYAIVTPTNQGNYAKISRLKEPIFHFNSASFRKNLEVKLEEPALLDIAEKGDIFSYVAGVAHEIITNYQHYNKWGIKIDNYKTDLPIKKGLSSSASICVLTAKAFNELFDLKWTPKRIMEVAYLGEITTPSRCGKLDQACAYDKPILMTFDADKLKVEELNVGKNIYMLIVDLKAKKNTKKILTDLNRGFPFPVNVEEKNKHHYFNKINPDIIKEAIYNLKWGHVKDFGKVMTRAQEFFDSYLAPSCPGELTAPKLHEVLNFPEIQNYIYGGKGVGSGGDGAAQFICKSKEDRGRAKNILEKKLGLECFDLDLKKT